MKTIPKKHVRIERKFGNRIYGTEFRREIKAHLPVESQFCRLRASACECACVCHMFDFDDSINDVCIFKRNQPNGNGELLAIRTNKLKQTERKSI